MGELILGSYTIETPIIDIVKQIKSEIHNGKLKDIINKGKEIVVTCPIHKDGKEDKPASSLHNVMDDDLEYGTFHCFACGAVMGLPEFVNACFDEEGDFGKDWLIERFGILLVERTLKVKEIEDDKPIVYMDEKELDKLEPYHPYMEKRKLSREVCEKFKVKYDPSDECIVFPVRDKSGKLLYVTKRSVNTKEFKIPPEVDKPVYLLDDKIKHNKTSVYVVESQINALTLESWGYPAIALFGTGSDTQYEILSHSGIRSYTLCFDGDEAGEKGALRFIKKLSKKAFIDVVQVPSGKDVNDLTKEQFESLL